MFSIFINVQSIICFFVENLEPGILFPPEFCDEWNIQKNSINLKYKSFVRI